MNAGVSASVSPSATGQNGTLSFAATADATEAVETETFAAPSTLTVLAWETITLSEGTVPAGYDVALVCEDDGTPITVTAGANLGEGSFVVPNDPTALSCEWTNTRLSATLTLAKTWVNADAAETATLSATGIANVSVPAPADGVIAQETETYGALATMTIYAGETVILAETGLPANYTASLSCTDGTTITTSPNLSVADVPLNTTCTWTNTRNTAVLTLEKDWVKADADEATTLSVSSPLLGSQSYSGAGVDANNDATDALESLGVDTLTVFGGETLTFAEAAIPGYTQTLVCDGATIGADGSGNLVLADAPTNFICTWTNERNSTLVTVQKTWVDAVAGAQADLDFIAPARLAASATSTATGPAAQTETVFTSIEVFAGETLTLQETNIQAGYAVSAFTCDTLSLVPLTDGGGDPIAGSGTVTLGDTPPATATCGVTNTRAEQEQYLTKVWVNAKANETTTLSATATAPGGGVTDSGSGTSSTDGTEALETETDTNITTAPNFPIRVLAGDTVTLSESPVPSGYDVTLVCANGLDNIAVTSTGAGAGTIVTPTGATDPALNCTWTNTRRSATLSVSKVWVNADVGEGATLVADGLEDLSQFAPADANGVAETETYADLDSMNIYAEETVSLSETGLNANYSASLSCDNGTASATTGAASFVVDATPVDVSCTWTNTRKFAELTVQKVWVDADGDEAATLSVTSPLLGALTLDAAADSDATNDNETLDQATLLGRAGSSADLSAHGGQFRLYAGESLSLSETTLPGYDQTLVCETVEATPTTLINSTSGAGSFAIPSDPLDVTCTWTNTRRSTLVSLQKNWIGGQTGDGATFRVVGGDETPGDIAFTASSDGDFSQGVGTAFKAFPGEALTFTEPALDNTYTAGPFSCDTLTLDGSGSVTLSTNPPATALCDLTNTRATTTLVLNNIWVNAGPSGQADVTVTEGSGAAQPFTSTHNNAEALDTEPDNGFGSLTVTAGETITLAQPGVPDGYDVSLSCEIGGTPLLTNTSAGTGSFVVPGGTILTNDINCTWTHTRKTATLTLNKSWVNADGGAATDLSVSGLDNLVTSSSVPGTAFTANFDDDALGTLTIYAGETLSFAETNLPAAYAPSLSCGGALVTSAETGMLVVDLDPSNLDCRWTNTRRQTNLTVTKNWVNALTGAEAVIEVAGGQNAPGSETLQAASDGDTSDIVGGASFIAYAGETLTLAETSVPAGFTASAFTCGALTVGAGGEILIPDSPNAAYACEITNTRNQASLSLEKTWVNAEASTSVTPSATSPDGTLSFTATSDGDTDIEEEVLTSPTSLIVSAGDLVTLSEGAVPAGYEATLICEDNGTALSVSPGSGPGTGSFTVPDDPTALSCQWRNERRSALLILNVVWENAAIEEPAGVSADGMNDISAAPAEADQLLNSSQTQSSVGFMTVYSGETVGLTPTVPAGYDAALSCDAGTLVNGGNGLGDLTLPAVPMTTNCTWTLTRRSTTLSLEKNWVNPHNGAAVDLEAIGALQTIFDASTFTNIDVTSTFTEVTPTNVASTGLTDTNQVADVITVYAGETFELAEGALPTGYTAGSWACTDASGTIVLSGGDAVTIPDTPNGVLTCGIINTRNAVAIAIDKQWADAIVGNSASISIDGISDASGTTTAGAVDETVLDVVTSTIQAGETLTVSEPLISGYDSDLVCSDATVSGSAPNWSVEVPFDQTANVGCTLTNDRRPTLQIGVTSIGSIASFDFVNGNTLPATLNLVTATDGVEVLGPGQSIIDPAQPVDLSELPLFGWSVSSITCQDQESGVLVSNANSNTISLSAAILSTAQDIVCSSVNTLTTSDIVMTKSVTPEVASAGEVVTYTVTAQNTSGVASGAGGIKDLLPDGFAYVAGSARLSDNSANKAAREPSVTGQTLTWTYASAGSAPLDELSAGETLTLTYDALVVDGTTRDTINRVVHVDAFGAENSVPAEALVTVLEDPGMICSTIVGTVWNDLYGPLDGISRVLSLEGVRVITPDGQVATTDDQGRFSIPCIRTRGARGAESRVESVPLKIVEITLPEGYAVDGPNPQLINVTPGKVTTVDFSASFQNADNRSCSVPFTDEERAAKEAAGVVALFDSSLATGQCRDLFWFVSAQLVAEGEGSQLGSNRTATNARVTAYFKGYVTGKTLLTLGYEARGSEIDDFTSGVLSPDVERLLDEIEDEDLFPVFADRSTLSDDTPTSGGFYIRLEREDDTFIFGDVELEARGNELVVIDRQVYGAVLDLRWGDRGEADDTSGGAAVLYQEFDTFARSSEIFTGLGNSAFYLSQENVVPGSLTAEVRLTDPISGQILRRSALSEGEHFWVQEAQGLLRLSQPLLSIVPGIGADVDVALYVAYEYIANGLESDGGEIGGRVEQAVGENLIVGTTFAERSSNLGDQRVVAGDALWTFGEASYLRVDIARSSGTAPGVLASDDGGLTFALLPGSAGAGSATAITLDLDGTDFDRPGLSLRAYLASTDAGFASLDGQAAGRDDLSGALDLVVPLGEVVQATASVTAGDLGGSQERVRTELGIAVQPSETARVGASLIEETNQGLSASGVELSISGTRADESGSASLTITETQDLDPGAQSLDAVTLALNQDIAGGGSVGLIVQEIDVGIEVAASLASSQEGALTTYAEFEQRGEDFDDLDESWITTGFRYQADERWQVFGETRQALGDTRARSEIGLAYDLTSNVRLGLSALDDQTLALDTQGISVSLGWDGDLRNGTMRAERSLVTDRATGEVQEVTTYTYRGNTFELGLIETALAFDYVSSQALTGSSTQNQRTAEIEGSLAWRGGQEDNLTLLALYSADYSMTPTVVGGSATYAYALEQVGRIDLTYKFNPRLTLGGAYAVKQSYSGIGGSGNLTLDEREELGIIRLDAKLTQRLGVVLEGRAYRNSVLTNMQVGLLEYLYFDINENARIALGYSQSAIGIDPQSLGAIDEGWFLELSSQY